MFGLHCFFPLQSVQSKRHFCKQIGVRHTCRNANNRCYHGNSSISSTNTWSCVCIHVRTSPSHYAISRVFTDDTV